jgi:hypothetical protein
VGLISKDAASSRVFRTLPLACSRLVAKASWCIKTPVMASLRQHKRHYVVLVHTVMGGYASVTSSGERTARPLRSVGASQTQRH